MQKLIIILLAVFILSSVTLDELNITVPKNDAVASEQQECETIGNHIMLFASNEQQIFIIENTVILHELNQQGSLLQVPYENTEDSTCDTEETEKPLYIVPCSEEDYQNLLRIVEAEATDADVLAKILVANVIINRVNHSYFPNNITEVIFQGNGEQFSPIYDGRFYTVEVQPSTIEAVERALAGEDYSQGALFFAAPYCLTPESWHNQALTRLFEYGGHVYFTFPEGRNY